MTKAQVTKIMADDPIEWTFVLDYSEFALHINFETVAVLYEKALTTEDSLPRKSICLAGMQLMFSSWEDFALLLQAFRKKREDGMPLYKYLCGKGQHHGSSAVPSIFKNYESARKMLDELGLTSINHRSLTKYYSSFTQNVSKVRFHRFIDPQISVRSQSMSKAQFERIFRSFANEVRSIGKLQQEYNELKNRLKHGKGIIDGVEGCDNTDKIAYLEEVHNSNKELQLRWFGVSISSLSDAVIRIAQLYQRSLELLWLFMIQYYPEHVEEHRRIYVAQTKLCQKRIIALEIKTKYGISAGESTRSFKPKI